MNGSYTKADSGGLGGLNPSRERSPYRFAQERIPTSGSFVPGFTPVSIPAPAPPRTRSRGRFLIILLLLGACAGGVFTVWDSLLRYRAYGVVTGRIVDVASPIDGVVTTVHVAEGEKVHQNDPLARIYDLKLEQSLARISDELRITEAQLNAEIARIQWQSHVDETEMTRSIAEFFESTGKMHEEVGNLALIREQLTRNEKLTNLNAASKWDTESFRIQEKAAEENLNSIRQSLVVLKERAEKAAASPRLGSEQIQPLLAKSEMLLNEIQRIRGMIALGELRAPVNGIVLRRHHPAGECLKSHEPLFSVMEESTLEIELFLPQELSMKYGVGDTVEVRIEPYSDLVPCEVISIGTEHRQPPEQIEIFYRSNVQLLPIRLKPRGPVSADGKLHVGAVAKLPHFNSIF